MPSEWMDQHMGAEGEPRPGFEDALANDLRREWRGGANPRWRIALWGAAAAALLVGVIVVATRDGDRTVTPVDTTVPATATTEPSVDETMVQVSPGGSSMVAIGDSVMAGAAVELNARGVTVDASESRGPIGTLEVVDVLVVDGVIGRDTSLVIHVGLNGPISAEQFDAIVDAVPIEVSVGVVTVVAPVEWADENNEAIRQLPARHPNVRVYEWSTVAESVELCADQVHVSCNPAAVEAYVGLLMSALEDDSDTTTTVTSTTSGNPLAPVEVVGTYLSALADGRYLDAAKLLSDGGLELEARADVRPLFSAEYGLVPGQATLENVAAALEKWCARSMCEAPFEVTQSDGFRQIATYDYGGQQRASTFVGGSYEGQPVVLGLPLQARPQYQWVECPTEAVSRVTWADLDGDGWWEQLVVQSFDIEGSEMGGGRNVITACGSQVDMEPFEMIDGEGVWVYAVNPDLEGPDDLLIGSVPPFPSGSVYRYDGTRLVATEGTFGFITPMVDQPGHSTGCRDLDQDGVPELVNNTFRYLGGSDLSTSTQLMTEVTPSVGGVAERITFELPAEVDAAFELVVGYCNGLPVMTDGN